MILLFFKNNIFLWIAKLLFNNILILNLWYFKIISGIFKRLSLSIFQAFFYNTQNYGIEIFTCQSFVDLLNLLIATSLIYFYIFWYFKQLFSNICFLWKKLFILNYFFKFLLSEFFELIVLKTYFLSYIVKIALKHAIIFTIFFENFTFH